MKMQYIRTYGSLFMAMLACFVLGLYSASTFKYGQFIEPHRWVITSIIGLFFLVNFLVEHRGAK